MLFTLAKAQSPEDFLRVGLPFEVVMVLFMLCLLAWLWSMGSFLNSIGQTGLRLKPGFFRIALLYPAVYVFAFFAVFQSRNPVMMAGILPLHFFAMFCVFYDSYFVSKTLVHAETGKLASFYDYAGSFFLIWFFPIGVWFIQPRINRIYAQPVPHLQSIEAAGGYSPAVSPTKTTDAYSHEIRAGTLPVHAGLWLRIAAGLIDGLVISFPLFILAIIVIVMVRIISPGKGYDPALGVLAALLAVAIVGPWFYFSILESSPWQATIGKSVMRLYVSDLEGHRLTRGRAMGRNLAKCLSNLTVGGGYLMCGYTERKQALHDILAKSLVLRRPKS